MKNFRSLLVAFIIIAATSFAGDAQVSKDSLNSLKNEKEVLKLQSKINAQKTDLAKLENELAKKTSEVESTSAEAKKAADENAEAANNLSNDPQDKARARKAENAGDAARKSAKRARIAGDDLDKLKRNIESLRNKIADEEAKLPVPLTQP